MLQSVELDASQQTLRLLEASGLLGTETERLRAGEVRKRPVGQLAKQLALQAFSRFTAGRG